jgi:hypothetical protein
MPTMTSDPGLGDPTMDQAARAAEGRLAAAGLLDAAGRVGRWPKRKDDQRAVLAFLAGAFAPGRDYGQAEVNALIDARHGFGDFALLRRELIVAGLLERTPDCRRYWRPAAASGGPAADGGSA